MTAPISAIRLFNPSSLPPTPGRLTPSQVQARQVETQLRELPAVSPVRTAMSAEHAEAVLKFTAPEAGAFWAMKELKDRGAIRPVA